jgi:hypothetical protein
MFRFLNTIFLCAALTGSALLAQDPPKPRVSPAASVFQTIGENTVITIDYSRPAVKGRTIWGDLVPYGKVWRTGANEATRFTVSQDVMIDGNKLAAGSYSLFTIPTEKEWTVIFNKVAEQWGAFNYDDSQDALRITVTPRSAPHTEWLSFAFEDLDSTQATVVLYWEKLAVPFQVTAAVPGEKIRKSLKAGFSQTLGVDTKIEMIYSRPGVKGREIWGGLVPYDSLWRTGANENTVFKTSGDITVNGQKLPAGSYGFFTIPGEKEWTLIFSKKDDHRGTSGYDPANDALRLTVAPKTGDRHVEWFTIAATNLTLAEKQVNAATVELMWEKLRVPFTVALP